MKAHVIHDAGGNIRSVVFQATEVDGELEISTDQAGDSVTVVDLDDAVAQCALGRDELVTGSDEELSSVARKIRSGFRIAAGGRTLERMIGGKGGL